MGIPFETIIEIKKPSSILTRLNDAEISLLQDEKKAEWNGTSVFSYWVLLIFLLIHL